MEPNKRQKITDLKSTGPPDVVVAVGRPGEDYKEYSYHCAVIATFCHDYMDTSLSYQKEEEVKKILLPNFSSAQWDIFDQFILYPFEATITPENVSILLPIFHFFCMENLLNKCGPIVEQSLYDPCPYGHHQGGQDMMNRCLKFFEEYGHYNLPGVNDRAWKIFLKVFREHGERCVNLEIAKKIVDAWKHTDLVLPFIEKYTTSQGDYINDGDLEDDAWLEKPKEELANCFLLPHMLLHGIKKAYSNAVARDTLIELAEKDIHLPYYMGQLELDKMFKFDRYKMVPLEEEGQDEDDDEDSNDDSNQDSDDDSNQD